MTISFQASDSRGLAERVAAVDLMLANHRDFADTERILGRARARYEFGLEILADYLPGVAAALPLLQSNGPPGADGRHLLRDPVLQMALEAALWRLERDELGTTDDLEDVVALISPALAALDGRLPTEAEQGRASRRAGPNLGIWLPSLAEHAGPLQGRLARAMTEQFLGSNRVDGSLLAAEPEMVELVDRASELLTTMLPGVGDVLRHVTVLAPMRGSGAEGHHISAAGGDFVPGTIVIDPAELEDPWEAASILLHEALHLRLFDISRAFALTSQPTATAPIPWRRVDWDLRRILFAFHVYVHLMLYDAAASAFGATLSGRFGALTAHAGVTRGTDVEYASAEARTRYLGEQLTGPLWSCLTREGQRLVRWLVESVAPITDRPIAPLPEATSPRTFTPTETVGTYLPADGLQTRPLPELACMFVFNPAKHRMHYLNLSAWLVFELCDGRTDLEDAYRELGAAELIPNDAAAHHLRLALKRLTEMGLIREGGDRE